MASIIILSPRVALAAVRSPAGVLFLMAHCLMFLPVIHRGSMFGP